MVKESEADMKKTIRALIAACIVAAMPIAGVSAKDYFCDFENGSTDGFSINSAQMSVEDSGDENGNALHITSDNDKRNFLYLNVEPGSVEDEFVISYTYRQFSRAARYFYLRGYQSGGQSDYASILLRHKNDGGLYYDPSGSNNAGSWFANSPGNGYSETEWNYVSLLVNRNTRTCKIAYVRKDGTVERGEAIRMTGAFNDRIAGDILGLQVTSEGFAADDCWYDDVTVANVGTDADFKMSPIKTSIEEKAVPEERTVTLKYPICSVKTGYANGDNVKITAEKNGETQEIKNFEIDENPNSISISFGDDLISNAVYTVSFADSVTNAFGQKLADYTFKTGAAAGTCLVESVKFFNSDKETDKTAILANVSKIEIKYENPMSDGFDGVSLDGAEFESGYNENTRTQTLTLKKALKPFTEYELVIPSGPKDVYGNSLDGEKVRFSTIASAYDISYDITAGGKEVTSLKDISAGGEFEVKTVLNGMDGQTDSAYMWVTFYGADGGIKGCAYKTFNSADGAAEALKMPEGTENGQIRIIITDESFRPLGQKCIITGGGINE